MRKIDLTDYATGVDDGKFLMRTSLAAVLFNQPNLDARELIRRDEFARRIEACIPDEILIESADWTKLVDSLNATDMRPYGRTVVECVRRVLNAPEVNVKEA